MNPNNVFVIILCMSFVIAKLLQLSSNVLYKTGSYCIHRYRTVYCASLYFMLVFVRGRYYLSRVMRKPAFCKCENKGADQLRGNRKADQRLCFRYIDGAIPLLPKYEISSFWPSCVVVQLGLCGTWSEPLKTGFLTTRLICYKEKNDNYICFYCMQFKSKQII